MTGLSRIGGLLRGRMGLVLWLAISLATGAALAFRMTSAEASKQLFLPGETTRGHYQIELECAACHTKSFTTGDDFQAACVKCHGQELERAEDSHPRGKFTDPRNADRVESLDARYCVTCHVEHQPARTKSMGLSLPADYCYHCHLDIAEERPSHDGLPFESCASAGCHNFHDNKALYEDFLARHGQEPPLLSMPLRPLPEMGECPSPARSDVKAQASPDQCRSCHEAETESWLGGSHGMRVAQGLSPMKPGWARLKMKPESGSQELTCASCHQQSAGANALEKEVVSCEGCHADEHTRAYRGSKHFTLLKQEMDGRVARGSGVTCATCHMPRLKGDDGDLWVSHNQNDNLRPNEKMIRTACANCHGVPFAIDALADARLIANNFTGLPKKHVPSVDFALARK